MANAGKGPEFLVQTWDSPLSVLLPSAHLSSLPYLRKHLELGLSGGLPRKQAQTHRGADGLSSPVPVSPPGFAEWALLLHICRRIPKVLPAALSTTTLFLSLSVQNHQRSSECGGIFSRFPKNALQARSERNLPPSPETKGKKEQSLYPSPFPVAAPAEDRQLGHPQASSDVPSFNQPCPTQR